MSAPACKITVAGVDRNSLRLGKLIMTCLRRILSSLGDTTFKISDTTFKKEEER